MPYYDASTRSKEQMRFRPPGARHTQNVWGLNGPGSGPEQDAYIEQQKRDLYGKGIRYTGLEGGGSRFGAEALPNFGSKRSIWDPVEKIKDYDFGPDIDARKASESEIRTYQDMLAANPSSKQFSKFSGMGASLWGGGTTPDVKEKYEYGTPASPDYGPMMELASMVNPSNISTEEARNFYGVAAPVLGSKRAESFLKPFTEAEKAMTTAGQKDMDAIRKGLETSYRPYLENNPALVPLFNEAYRTGDDSKLQAAITGGGIKTKSQAKKGGEIDSYMVENPNPDLTGQAALANYTSDVQKLALKLAKAEIPYPSSTALKDPKWQAIIQAASDYDPTFNAMTYQTRQSLRRSFTSGADAKNINSINTLVGHLNGLQKAATELSNASIPAWNTLTNFISSETGDPRVKRFNVALGAVEGELAAVFKGTGATDQEIKAWRERIHSSDSPEQLEAEIDEAVKLMASRLGALKNKYNTGWGAVNEDITILSPKSRSILTDMGIDPNTVEQSADTETGAGMAELPDPAAYKGRRIRNDETGEVFMSNGTAWVPA